MTTAYARDRMSWLRYFVLGDLGQQLHLHEQSESIGSMQSQIRRRLRTDARQDRQLDALVNSVHLVEAGFAALTTLLEKKGVITDGELGAMITSTLRTKPPPVTTAVAAAESAARAKARVRRRVRRKPR